MSSCAFFEEAFTGFYGGPKFWIYYMRSDGYWYDYIMRVMNICVYPSADEMQRLVFAEVLKSTNTRSNSRVTNDRHFRCDDDSPSVHLTSLNVLKR